MSRVLCHAVSTTNAVHYSPYLLSGLDISGILGNYVWEASEYFYFGASLFSLLWRSFQHCCSMFVWVFHTANWGETLNRKSKLLENVIPQKLSLRWRTRYYQRKQAVIDFISKSPRILYTALSIKTKQGSHWYNFQFWNGLDFILQGHETCEMML